eukprot:14748853-Alexandrium_andersonii.AAC.1
MSVSAHLYARVRTLGPCYTARHVHAPARAMRVRRAASARARARVATIRRQMLVVDVYAHELLS